MSAPVICYAGSPVIVVGSGITGLLTALHLAEGGRSVVMMAKGGLAEGSSRYAQGGMAVALGPGDSPEAHAQDTLVAGAGLCHPEAVALLTREAPARFEELLRRGVNFDMEAGRVALTLEGAHAHRRVVHAGGDATGAEIERALAAQAHAHPRVTVRERQFVRDLRVEDGRVTGVRTEHETVAASAVVIATGGLGRLFASTTNPPVATGDGLAMAYRAGASVRDLEFMQFHPTALYEPQGTRFLVSEAVRGEGGVLRDTDGNAFMHGVHPLKDLAPRDVVARAIAAVMAETGSPHVWLDVSHLPPDVVAHRFPTITKALKERGITLPQDPIPVTPAAHYACGGIVTDLSGRTGVRGLFAAGEAAWTGVHGANRLASNSLLECVVFGARVAEAILADDLRMRPEAPGAIPGGYRWGTGPLSPLTPALSPTGERRRRRDMSTSREIKEALPALMWRNVGLLRDAAGLKAAIAQLDAWLQSFPVGPLSPDADWEILNMLTNARLMAEAALRRTESRGCHFRLDHPETKDRWITHVTIQQIPHTPSPSSPSILS